MLCSQCNKKEATTNAFGSKRPVRHCSECSTAYQKQKYLGQKEEQKRNKLKYYEMNREKILEQKRIFYKENRDDLVEKKKRYTKTIEFKIWHRQYVSARRRRVKISSSRNQRDAVLEFYKNCPPGYEVDHIIPLSHPDVCGLHVLANLQYLTKRENIIKSNTFHLSIDLTSSNQAA